MRVIEEETVKYNPPAGAWALVGHVAVDSGQIMVTDPCYIYPDQRNASDTSPPALLKSWEESKSRDTPYLDLIGQWDYDNNQQLVDRVMDVEGLALNFSTYYGDGVYPVYAKLDDRGRPMGFYVDMNPSGDD